MNTFRWLIAAKTHKQKKYAFILHPHHGNYNLVSVRSLKFRSPGAQRFHVVEDVQHARIDVAREIDFFTRLGIFSSFHDLNNICEQCLAVQNRDRNVFNNA